ncbi:hypothetical protein BDZ97DRAFT_1771678 [Flammula alnicola]|nr:hypothetical protein BDZ97DRAFT_1771678 [Flammula alnicola]
MSGVLIRLECSIALSESNLARVVWRERREARMIEESLHLLGLINKDYNGVSQPTVVHRCPSVSSTLSHAGISASLAVPTRYLSVGSEVKSLRDMGVRVMSQTGHAKGASIYWHLSDAKPVSVAPGAQSRVTDYEYTGENFHKHSDRKRKERTPEVDLANNPEE